MTDHQGEYPTEPTGEGTGQPEGSAAPPPADPPAPDAPAAPAPPPAAPAAPPAASYPTGGGFDADKARATLQGANRLDLGIIAVGVVAFLASFMPFYSLSVSIAGYGGTGSWSAWHGFFGWFAALVALAGAAAVALDLFNVVKLPMAVHQIAAGAFGLALLCLILALFVNPLPSCGGLPGCSRGHGFGYWLALLCALAGTGLSVMRMRETTGTTAGAA